MSGFLPEREFSETRVGRLTAVAVVVIAVVVLCFAVPGLPKTFQIGFGKGHQGVYVIGELTDCGKRRCHSYSGTFTSDDGTIRRTGVGVDGLLPRNAVKGGAIRAFDVGDPQVYSNDAVSSGFPWGLPLFFTVLALVAIVVSSLNLWRTRPRRGERGR